MKNLFFTLPRFIIVSVLIVGGVFLIILMDPPHTVCDTQINTFKEKQNIFLYQGEKQILGKATSSDYKKLLEICVKRNSSGGCSELSLRIKEMLRDFDLATEKCSQPLSQEPQVKKVIWESLEMLTRGAWGVKPPSSVYDKFGWLTPADINLYCRLKLVAQDNYSKQDWEAFRERMIKTLMDGTGLTRDTVWQRILLSTRCDSYL